MKSTCWKMKGHWNFRAIRAFAALILVAGAFQVSDTWGNQSSNAFFAGKRIFFERGFIDVARQQLQPDVVISVKDERNRPLEGFVKKTNDGGVRIELPNRGYYELDALGCNGRCVVAHATAAVIAAPPYGKGSFGFFGSQNRDYRLAALAGANWARVFVPLPRLPKGAGAAKHAGSAMNEVDVSLSPSLDWIGVLMNVPPDFRLHPSGKPAGIPSDWSKFHASVRAGLSWMGGALRYVEVINEPDWIWSGSDEELVTYFAEARKAITSKDPSIKILGPSTATIDLSRIRRLFDVGLLPLLDGIAVHNYVHGSAPEEEFWARLRGLKELVHSYGSEMPIFVTEFGWTTDRKSWQPPVSELQQAQYLARAMILLHVEGVKSALSFALDLSHDQKLAGYSAIQSDGSPRPSYVAFATVARWLNDTFFVRFDESFVPGNYSATFRSRDGEKIIVMWSAKGDAIVNLPCVVRQTEDMMGRSLPISATASSIKISPSPIAVRCEL